MEFIIDFKQEKAFYKESSKKWLDGDSILFKFFKEENNNQFKIYEKLLSNVTDNTIKLNKKSIEKFNNDLLNSDILKQLKIMDYSSLFSKSPKEICQFNRCRISIFYSNKDSEDYIIRSHFPKDWDKFGQIIENLTGIDVLNIKNLNLFVNEYNYNIGLNGVYSKQDKKLDLEEIVFATAGSLIGDIYRIKWKLNFKNKTLTTRNNIHKLDDDLINHILFLLKKYGVYKWYDESYLEKVINNPCVGFDGKSWEMSLIFQDNVHLIYTGHENYPDTYLHLGKELKKLIGEDLLEIKNFHNYEIDEYENYGDKKVKY